MLNDLNVPDEYLRAIGRVAVEWNRVEGFLELLLSRMIGKASGDPKALIVFTHMAFNQRLDALMALLEEESKRMGNTLFLEEFRSKVLPKLRELQGKRNKVIHSSWFVKDNVVQTGTITARGSLKFTRKEMVLEEIEQIHKDITALSETLFLVYAGQEVTQRRPTKGAIAKSLNVAAEAARNKPSSD